MRGVQDCAAVAGLEHADSLHDRPEARVVVVVEHQRREAEMPGRLVRGVVPDLAARLAGERRQLRPGRAVVAALEDPRRLDADEDPPGRRASVETFESFRLAVSS